MKEQKDLSIANRYSIEIQNIDNKLRDLENGRIYELTGATMDGFLSTNAKQLRKMIAELLVKIDKQSPSLEDDLSSIFFSEIPGDKN